jgi:hypothetical protein
MNPGRVTKARPTWQVISELQIDVVVASKSIVEGGGHYRFPRCLL